MDAEDALGPGATGVSRREPARPPGPAGRAACRQLEDEADFAMTQEVHAAAVHGDLRLEHQRVARVSPLYAFDTSEPLREMSATVDVSPMAP